MPGNWRDALTGKLPNITPKQASMVYARLRAKGVGGRKEMFEWLEYECGVYVTKDLDEIKAPDLDRILRKIDAL